MHSGTKGVRNGENFNRFQGLALPNILYALQAAIPSTVVVQARDDRLQSVFASFLMNFFHRLSFAPKFTTIGPLCTHQKSGVASQINGDKL
jgi:hypothetical protein